LTRDAGASGLHSHAGAWERETDSYFLVPTLAHGNEKQIVIIVIKNSFYNHFLVQCLHTMSSFQTIPLFFLANLFIFISALVLSIAIGSTDIPLLTTLHVLMAKILPLSPPPLAQNSAAFSTTIGARDCYLVDSGAACPCCRCGRGGIGGCGRANARAISQPTGFPRNYWHQCRRGFGRGACVGTGTDPLFHFLFTYVRPFY